MEGRTVSTRRSAVPDAVRSASYRRHLMQVVTFRVGGRDTRAVLGSLGELGFTFEAPRAATTTVLDTFDGRVHRAGCRLELHDAEQLELVLSGEDIVPAHLVVDAAPRVPTDLPPGPFRSRIDALVQTARCCRNCESAPIGPPVSVATGPARSVATARLHEAVQVVDRPDIDAFTTIEIREVAGYAKHFRQCPGDAAPCRDRRSRRRRHLDAIGGRGRRRPRRVHREGDCPARPRDAGDRRIPTRARQPRRRHHGELAGHHRPDRSGVPARLADRRASHPHRAGRRRRPVLPGVGPRPSSRWLRVAGAGSPGRHATSTCTCSSGRATPTRSGAEVARRLEVVRGLLEPAAPRPTANSSDASRVRAGGRA